jgi:hypothetical protein
MLPSPIECLKISAFSLVLVLLVLGIFLLCGMRYMTFTNSDGVECRYFGFFQNGTAISGKLFATDGSFIKFSQQSGSARLLYSDGSVYKGQIVGFSPDGDGSYTAPDGTKYSGEFKDGTFFGQGICEYPDGSRYEGEFKNGLKNGD